VIRYRIAPHLKILTQDSSKKDAEEATAVAAVAGKESKANNKKAN
jgi:hypothetical protein